MRQQSGKMCIVIPGKTYHKTLTTLTDVCTNGNNYYICSMMYDSVLTAITDEYGTDMTVGELMRILHDCGFDDKECREMVRRWIDDKEVGRVSYRNLRRNMPPKNTVLFLKKKKNFWGRTIRGKHIIIGGWGVPFWGCRGSWFGWKSLISSPGNKERWFKRSKFGKIQLYDHLPHYTETIQCKE